MLDATILAIFYGATSMFYLTYAVVVFVFDEKANPHIRILFPVIHTHITKREVKVLSFVAVTVMTTLVMLGLMRNSAWAVVVAIILSLWEVVLACVFYYPRKEKLNAIMHFVLHSIIVVYLIAVFLQVII